MITRTAEEIAGILRCSPRTVTRKVRAGEWPGRLIAGRYVFTAEDLAEILERCRAKPATPPAAVDRPVVEVPRRRRRIADRVPPPKQGGPVTRATAVVTPLTPKTPTRRRRAS